MYLLWGFHHHLWQSRSQFWCVTESLYELLHSTSDKCKSNSYFPRFWVKHPHTRDTMSGMNVAAEWRGLQWSPAPGRHTHSDSDNWQILPHLPPFHTYMLYTARPKEKSPHGLNCPTHHSNLEGFFPALELISPSESRPWQQLQSFAAPPLNEPTLSAWYYLIKLCHFEFIIPPVHTFTHIFWP